MLSVTSLGLKTAPREYDDLDLDDIDYDSETGEVDIYFNEGMKALKAVYKGGYNITGKAVAEGEDVYPTIPSDLSELIVRLSMRLYKRLSDEGKKSIVFDKSNVTFDKILQDEDKAILDNAYRNTFI